MNLKSILLATFGGLAISAAVPAGAALNWNFANGTGNCTAGTNAGCWGNVVTRTSTGGSPNMSASAEAYSSTGAGGIIQDAYLASWGGGLGVANRNTSSVDPYEGTPRATTAPEHSVDSQGTNAISTTNGVGAVYDSVLFTFAADVKLTQVTLGWAAYDSDISVLAYVGGGTPAAWDSASSTQTYANLTSNGWVLVGNYSNVAGSPAQSAGGTSGTFSTFINGASNADDTAAIHSSKYWLVGAYNPVFDGSDWTAGNDFVKLKSVAGYKTPDRKVSEPGALGLIAMSLVGVFAMRGRKRIAPEFVR